MNMKKFTYKEIDFVVQSYKKNDFANICEINGDSFRIDFTNNTISTSGKENQFWIEKKSKFDIKEIKIILEDLFYFKYCQSNIEDNGKCEIQCNHCRKYYDVLE